MSNIVDIIIVIVLVMLWCCGRSGKSGEYVVSDRCGVEEIEL